MRLLVSCLLLFMCCVSSPAQSLCASSFYSYENLEAEAAQPSCVIHMMFFPWDNQKKLLADEFVFDHGPYEAMQKKVEGENHSRVVMWTFSKSKAFCQKNYPQIWDALEKYAVRPVMYVDVLRWVVVYHYGGIYWQYDSVPLCSSMSSYLPGEGKEMLLLSEKSLSFEERQKYLQQPIRRGKEVSDLWVATKIFSASLQKSPVTMSIINFILARLKTEKVLCDYDVLYITGDVSVSDYYEKFGKNNPKIELLPLDRVEKMVFFNPKGRWRTDS